MLLEYQHYVVAHRLRSALGGRVAPRAGLLTLADYAERRTERQQLARRMITEASPPESMGQMDRLTDELMFGFWHNPLEVTAFLRAALRQGGHPVFTSPEQFAGLLSDAERRRLGPSGTVQVGRYYLTCLQLAAPGSDPHALEYIFERLEPLTPPLFIDELNERQRTA